MKTVAKIRRVEDLVLVGVTACSTCAHHRRALIDQCGARGESCGMTWLHIKHEYKSPNCPWWEPKPRRRSLLRWLWDTLLSWR